MTKSQSYLRAFASAVLALGIFSLTPISKVNADEGSISNPEVAQPTENAEANDNRPHWMCIAKNFRREEFMGRGDHRHSAEERALERCRHHTPHHHRHSCFIEHCRRHHD